MVNTTAVVVVNVISVLSSFDMARHRIGGHVDSCRLEHGHTGSDVLWLVS